MVGQVNQQEKGFTLLEILAVLAIIGFLVSIATPSFIRFQRRIELENARNTLVSAIRLARSNASESRVGSSWVVYVDDDPVLGEVVVRVQPATPVPPNVFNDPTPPQIYQLGRNIELVGETFDDFNSNTVGICPEPGQCAVFDSKGEARDPSAPDAPGFIRLGTFILGARGLPDTDLQCVRVSTALGAIRTFTYDEFPTECSP